MEREKLIDGIRRLKDSRGAVILAHYYSDPDVQDVSDFLGDSLELARKVAATDAETVVFCGVHFMAETASIISPDKRILIPVQNAGCSLADSITGEDIRKWRSAHPKGVVVSYVNTTADVKAETDICCTSANAASVVKAVYDGKVRPDFGGEVLFTPDACLGNYINGILGVNMDVWNGNCRVHKKITAELVRKELEGCADSQILIHPESSCSLDASVTGNARCHFFSTSGIIKYVKESSEGPFVIATETGVMHKIARECQGKECRPINEDAVCSDMKLCTLQSLHDSLEFDRFEVRVPEKTAAAAIIPIRRMLEL